MAMEKQGTGKGQELDGERLEEDEIQEENVGTTSSSTTTTTTASPAFCDESMSKKKTVMMMNLVGSKRFALPMAMELTISKKKEYRCGVSDHDGGGYGVDDDGDRDGDGGVSISNMMVRDCNDNIVLTMISAPPPARRRRRGARSEHMKSLYAPPKLYNRVLVLDPARIPILCAHRKALSLYNRWDVFRGELPYPEEALFTVKRSAYFQLKTSLHVFLASHKNENKPQFKVKGSYSARDCTIFHESRIVAEVKRKYTNMNLPMDKDTFVVLVHPGMDYAFIVTLVAIMDEIHGEQEYRSSTSSG